MFAQDHRVAKPDRGIFEVVERELGVEPEVACSSVTTPSTTWRGPRSRLAAVWIDRDGSVPFPGDGPHPTPWCAR